MIRLFSNLHNKAPAVLQWPPFPLFSAYHEYSILDPQPIICQIQVQQQAVLPDHELKKFRKLYLHVQALKTVINLI